MFDISVYHTNEKDIIMSGGIFERQFLAKYSDL